MRGKKPAQLPQGVLGFSLTPATSLQVACEYGMVRVVSESGGPKGKDYCILYNPQWAHLPHDLSKAVSTTSPGSVSCLSCSYLSAPPLCPEGPSRRLICRELARGQRKDLMWETKVGSGHTLEVVGLLESVASPKGPHNL